MRPAQPPVGVGSPGPPSLTHGPRANPRTQVIDMADIHPRPARLGFIHPQGAARNHQAATRTQDPIMGLPLRNLLRAPTGLSLVYEAWFADSPVALAQGGPGTRQPPALNPEIPQIPKISTPL